jgi:hypothetical protein
MEDNIPVAVACYLNGSIFRKSAQQLMEGLELDGSGRPATLAAVPVYFLASHAAELFLKAALLKRHFVEADLKKPAYRHSLIALLREIRNKNVPVTEDTAAVIQALSEQHRTHQLRYTVLVGNGTKTYWPPPSLIFAALDELLLMTRISTHGV